MAKRVSVRVMAGTNGLRETYAKLDWHGEKVKTGDLLDLLSTLNTWKVDE
jgi:hypothetical protein